MDLMQTSGEQRSLASTIASMETLLAKVLPLGDVATLRRLRPGDSDCAAFWRIMALHEDALPAGGPGRDEAERRWSCILQAMAVLIGLHQPAVALGQALAQADVAELRALRLLRASGGNLADAVRVTAHQLAQKAVAANQADLAALVLSDGGPSEESVRRRIARSYYAKKAKEDRA